MGWIGRLISTKIEDYIINTVEKRLSYNVKSETYAPSGDDSVGLAEDRVYLGSIDGLGQSVVLGHLVISQGAKEGEKILYSRDANGDLVAKIYIQNKGKLLIETDSEIEVKSSTNLMKRKKFIYSQVSLCSHNFHQYVF
jgi:hypothetical protein